MSSAVRIPRELQEFLNLPGPQTLLVRGSPGSGKTTLSLALLEAFKGDKVLVTSRVSSGELHREFPWFGENGGRSIQVIDTSEISESVHDIARTMRLAREYLLAPTQRDGREAAQFLWLPSPLQDAWSRLREDRPSLIVVDSWDALVEGFLGGPSSAEEPVPDRGEIERMLIRRMGRSPAHLVFVLEREEQSALDYLVNGVVVTRRETANERLTRWMSFHKLRGVRIENPNYPFSLEGARFEGILPVGPYDALRPGPTDPETDPLPGFLWPGSRDFAASFGRLPIGKITLLEVDDDASPDVGNLLCLPAIAHALSLGGRALIVPHTTESPQSILESLNGSVPRSRFLSHVRMLLPPGPVPKGQEELYRVALPVRQTEPGAAAPRPEESEALRFLLEGATERTPGVMAISLQGLLGIAQALNLPITPELFARLPDAFHTATRAGAVHTMLIGRKSAPYLDRIRSISSLRLAMNLHQGRIFVHGVIPWTPKFVLTEANQDHPYRLLRVV